MPDHYQDDKNIVKALLSAGSKVYADYQEAALAHDLELNAQRKEMRKFNLDTAKMKLDSQMNTIRGYTALLQQKMQARRLRVEEGKFKSDDDKTTAILEGIQGLPHLSDVDKQIATILVQAGKDPSSVLTGEDETVHQKFFRSLDEVYPGDDEEMVAKRQQAKEQYIEKLTNIPAKDENEIQERINIAREIYKDNPEKLQQAIDKILIGSSKSTDKSDIEQARKDLADIKQWEADGEIDSETAALLRKGVQAGLGIRNKDTEKTPTQEAQEYLDKNKAFWDKGIVPPDLQKDLLSIRQQYTNQIKDLTVAKRSLIAMDKASKTDSPISEIAVLYAFIKAIDPGSVVREGEIGIVTRARGVMTQVNEMFEKAQEGTALSPKEKQDILAIGQSLRDAYQQDYDNVIGSYSATLKALDAYKKTDSQGNIIEFTDPEELIKVADLSDIDITPENADALADELKTGADSGKQINMQKYVDAVIADDSVSYADARAEVEQQDGDVEEFDRLYQASGGQK